MFLKLAIMNNSGNVGKSTICQTMLLPRLENAEIVSVETINNDGTSDEKMSAKEFDEIMKKIDETDISIIDIGASNIETFFVKMNDYKGSHDLIDYFLIPILPSKKQQLDSISTAESLIDLGVDIDNIKFIFNMANKDKPIEKQYSLIFEHPTCSKIAYNNKHAVIYQTDLFEVLSKNKLNYNEVYNDNRDFKSLIRSASNREERSELSNLRAIKMLMNGFNSNLDVAFHNLNLGNFS